jgi:hypothetical protein
MTKDFREKSNIIACTVSGTRYTLYECPAQCRARVPLVFITNVNGSVNVNFEIYKAVGATRFFIIGSKNMATGEFIQLSDAYLVLEPGDKLEVTATGTTPRVDAICTVEEIFRPTG